MSVNKMEKMTLDVRCASYRVGSKHLLKDVHFTCQSGELLGVMGPSGSGKTVLLNLLTFSADSSNSSEDRSFSQLRKVCGRKICCGKKASKSKTLLQANMHAR